MRLEYQLDAAQENSVGTSSISLTAGNSLAGFVHILLCRYDLNLVTEIVSSMLAKDFSLVYLVLTAVL